MTNKEILEMAREKAKAQYEERVAKFREEKADVMRAIRHAEGVIARGDIEFTGEDMETKAQKEEFLLTALGLDVKCHAFSKRIVIEVLEPKETELCKSEKFDELVTEDHKAYC